MPRAGDNPFAIPAAPGCFRVRLERLAFLDADGGKHAHPVRVREACGLAVHELFAIIRLYSPTEGAFDGSWKPSDLEAERARQQVAPSPRR
jgi:hypothetical protein